MTTTDRRDADDATAHGPDLAAAIATIEFSRQTHIEWAAHLRSNPDFIPGAVGDAAYHEQAVREYGNVLAVLAALKPAPGTDRASEEAPTATDVLRAGILLEPLDGLDIPHDAYIAARDGIARALAAAPGTDSSGRDVQRVLVLADELDSDAERAYQRSCGHRDEGSDGQYRAYEDAAARIRAAVAGPQRDHDEEGGQ